MKTMKSLTCVVLSVCVLLLSSTDGALGRTATSRTVTASSSSRAASALQRRRLQHRNGAARRNVQGTADYEPWPNGTPVAWQFPNEGWWSGVVTNYNDSTGMYTIKWEDGSVDYYDDIDQMDKMVAYGKQGLGTSTSGGGTSSSSNSTSTNTSGTSTNTGTQYRIGTPVTVYEEGQWWDGVIIRYSNGYYTVQWVSNNEIERVHEGSVIDKMVADAKAGDDAAAAADEADSAVAGVALWQNGTPVASFEENRWWSGQITGFANDVYTVTWKNGEVDTYSDFNTVNQMVSDAETLATSGGTPSPPPTEAPAADDTDDDTDDATDAPEETAAPTPVAVKPYPKGTIVYKDFEEDGWYVGELQHYKNGVYTVKWDDGSHDQFPAGPEMDEMVANAVYIPDDDSLVASGGELAATQQQQASTKGGMSVAGKVCLSIFVVVVVLVGALLTVKIYQRKRWAAKEAAQMALEEPRDDIVAYRDEPEDDVPRII